MGLAGHAADGGLPQGLRATAERLTRAPPRPACLRLIWQRQSTPEHEVRLCCLRSVQEVVATDRRVRTAHSSRLARHELVPFMASIIVFT